MNLHPIPQANGMRNIYHAFTGIHKRHIMIYEVHIL